MPTEGRGHPIACPLSLEVSHRGLPESLGRRRSLDAARSPRTTSPPIERSASGSGGLRVSAQNRQPSRSSTWPRRSGRTPVKARYAAPMPGTFAKTPCGPRDHPSGAHVVRRLMLGADEAALLVERAVGQSRAQVPASARHRENSPPMLPATYGPAPVTVPGGGSAGGPTSCSRLMVTACTCPPGYERHWSIPSRVAVPRPPS